MASGHRCLGEVAVCEAGEEVAQIGVGLNAVHFTSADRAGKPGPIAAPFIVPRKDKKNWLFAGSDKGGERIANILTIIETAKLHGHNPETYLTDVLTRIQSHPQDRLEELLPWQWTPAKDRYEAA